MDFEKIKQDKQRQDKIKMMSMVVSVMEQNLKRQNTYKDPLTRNSIFLEKILTVVDLIKAIMLIEYNDIPADLQKKIDNLIGIFNTNITSLIDMMQEQCFSPNHPYGKAMMDAAKNELNYTMPNQNKPSDFE